MSLQFKDIVAGKGMRGRKEKDEATVDAAAFTIPEAGEAGLACLWAKPGQRFS